MVTSKLLFVVPKQKNGSMATQTATTSAAPQSVRSGVKPCAECEAKKMDGTKPCTHVSQKQSAKKSGQFSFIGRFKEAAATADGQPGKRFRVTLLQEGLGNLGDAFYYTPEAIQTAVPIFEGKHFFVDHPSRSEEQDRPERSVRDLAGYFENVSAQQLEAGPMILTGDLVMIQDPSLSLVRAQLLESLSYTDAHPGEDLVGLSINASGDFNTLPIEDFLNSGSVPEACVPKLLEAIQQGVKVIRPVTEMKSAVSCDLVTTAGAGGKINQLLEGGKGIMKKESEKKEAEQKETDGMANGQKDQVTPGSAAGAHAAPAADGAQAPAPDDKKKEDDAAPADDQGDHPDAAQDQELILSLLQKYLGHGFSDDDMSSMGEAMQNAKEMGLEGKEAEECAGQSMKMSKHMQSKQAKAQMQSGADPAMDNKGLDSHGAATVPAASSKNGIKPKDQEESHKESAKAPVGVTQILAKLARTEQELNTLRLKEKTETVLRESGLPMSATKKFRESILPAIKSETQLVAEVKKFKEAFCLGGEAKDNGFILSAEKQTGELSEATGFGAGFADCVQK